MPIFEYICKDCGTFFEKIVPSYDSDTDCDKCHSPNVEKQLSVFAVTGPSRESATTEGPCGACGAARRCTPNSD